MVESLYQWVAPPDVALDSDCLAIGTDRGISERMLRLLAARGVASPDELRRFLGDPEDGLHDPRLLPDAEAAVLRVSAARARGERVLVYGDFDADGLTGLAILVMALRRLGLDAAPYAPERLADGHGLSLRAIETAAADGRTLILTADCGTSSGAEIEHAARRGIDVVVTDHHHAATWPSSAVAVVNPHRADSVLSGSAPDRRRSGLEVRPAAAERARRRRPVPVGSGADGSGDHRDGRGRRPDHGREPLDRPARPGAASSHRSTGSGRPACARRDRAREDGPRRHRVRNRAAAQRRREGRRGGPCRAAAAGRGRRGGRLPGRRDRGREHRAAGVDEELPRRGQAGAGTRSRHGRDRGRGPGRGVGPGRGARRRLRAESMRTDRCLRRCSFGASGPSGSSA